MRRAVDLSVTQRMSIGLAAMLAVIIALGAVVGVAHQRAAKAQQLYEQQALPRERAAHRLEASVMRLSISLRTYMRQPIIAQRDATREAAERVQQAWAEVVALEDDAAAIGAMKSAVLDYVADARATLGDLRGDWQAHADRLAARRDLAVAESRSYSNLQESLGGQRLEHVRQASAQAERAALIGALVTLALFGVIALLTVRAVQRPVRKLMRAAAALQQGDWQPALALDVREGDRARDELLRLGHAVAASAESMKRRNDELEAENRLATACAASLDPQQVADAALGVIVEQLAAPIGVLYRFDGQRLQPLAQYGLPAGLPAAELGEGLPGEAARQRRLLTLADLPADSGLLVRWGYDAAPARQLLAAPIEHRGELLGVLLTGSLHEWPPGTEAFVRTALLRLSASLANAEAHGRIAALLAELARSTNQVQRQNEQIQAQNEELQAQYEEIQAQNEELQAQTAEVLSQQEQLQAQNDALLQHRRQLQQQAEQLMEADRHKNHFLGVLAHELRNPMAPISNGLQILMQHACAPEQVDKIHAMLARQTRHLIRLIDDLLDITRISEKKIELKRETIELGELVRHVVDDFGTLANELDLQVDARIDADPIHVDGDPTRLSQITGNLLSNALKFSPPGSQVRVLLQADAGRARLSIVDAGEGISADMLPRVFEPFVQGSSHARGNAGLGLGLALVRELVALHGGDVQAYSDGRGQGARFSVELPLLTTPPLPRPRHDDGPGCPARRILLIEDKQDVADSLATLLRLYGHQVLEAATAADGIETACDWQPDLVLCDIGLPDLDGFAVARDLRHRLGDRILLCALSGHTAEADRQRSEAAGFDHHFAKPLDVEQLHRLLTGVLES